MRSLPFGGPGSAVTVSFIITVEFLDNYDRFIKSEKTGQLTQYLRENMNSYWDRNRDFRITNVESGY